MNCNEQLWISGQYAIGEKNIDGSEARAGKTTQLRK